MNLVWRTPVLIRWNGHLSWGDGRERIVCVMAIFIIVGFRVKIQSWEQYTASYMETTAAGHVWSAPINSRDVIASLNLKMLAHGL
jgi:hypothetical protein